MKDRLLSVVLTVATRTIVLKRISIVEPNSNAFKIVHCQG